MSPYSYSDYKLYLAEIVAKSQKRGMKAKLAEAAGCQRSFLSQVFNNSVHLTPDHSIGIAQFLQLDSKETSYFYNLVGLARAATPALRRFYESKLNQLRKKDDTGLANKLNATEARPEISEYYSSWEFAAVHIICTIAKYRKADMISKKLNISLPRTKYVLKRLESMGLVTNKRNIWNVTTEEIHLPADHFMNFTNHRNWREKNFQELQINPELNINYSAVYSMSVNDFYKLKEMVYLFLKESRSLVTKSEEEELVSFSLDTVLIT